MCKPFPPPLVRGGVFLVGLETKYRDIADGNTCGHLVGVQLEIALETKYRDIADGNCMVHRPPALIIPALETEYRDIAATTQLPQESNSCTQGNSLIS